MKYHQISPISREEAEEIFIQGEPNSSCDALLGLTYYDSDWLWVQDKCLELIREADIQVKGCAINCLGHLARIHHRLELDKVVPVLKELSRDEVLRYKAEDALDDIDLFMFGLDQ